MNLRLKSVILGSCVVTFASVASAGAAFCGKYSAVLKLSRAPVTILTHASEWTRETGYANIGTVLSGGVDRSCHQVFQPETARACGVQLTDVKLISDTDCWNDFADEATVAPKKVSCNAVNTTVGIEFVAPTKLGALPRLDFDYPVTSTLFSMRNGNLLLVAVDKDEPSRTRIVVSAQLDRVTKTYRGQMVTDEGGHEIQVDNGPVVCEIR